MLAARLPSVDQQRFRGPVLLLNYSSELENKSFGPRMCSPLQRTDTEGAALLFMLMPVSVVCSDEVCLEPGRLWRVERGLVLWRMHECMQKLYTVSAVQHSEGCTAS